MSLRVWLPLNGTLENKGLDDITPVLTGAVAVDNEGKIGKCYKFGTSLGRITIPPAIMREYNECSISFWVNILGWQTNWDTFFQAGLGTSPWNSYTFGVLRNQGNHVVFTISDGSTSSQGNYKSSDLALNTWHHLGFTYKSGHCCIYVNGNLYKDYSTNIIPNFGGINYISLGQLGNASSYQTNCKMNDVRIYDHALSPLEVKQISQGLILHYPLNRNGWGQENLAHNTYNLAPFSTSQVEFKAYNVGVLDVSNEETITISFDLDMIVATGGSGFLQVYNTNYPGPHQITSFNALGGRTLIVGQNIHERISHTTTMATRSSYSYSYDTIEFYSNYSTENEIQISNIKIERGSIATPWCPNSSDTLTTTMGLNDNIEYDTSGYGNNGIKVGTFDYDSDTPKYNVSTVFNGVDNCIQIGNWYTLFQNPFTINVWFKKDEIGSKGYETLLGGGSGFEIDTRAGNSQTLSLYLASARGTAYSPFNFTQWYMVTMVSDGTNELYYVDGILRKTIEKKGIPNNMYRIGAWSSDTSQNFKGQMSDFRIYATALSADDVKSLYNNSAYIDNQGNIYGAVYEEV